MLQLYEFHDASRNSHKFWEVRVSAPGRNPTSSHWAVEIRWGRIGTRGQHIPKREFFQTESEARAFAEKSAAAKRRKGYRRVVMPAEMAARKAPLPQPDALAAILAVDADALFTF
ncbi:MAG TPA: WGR domain-containing protein [Myxococcota bacterium]